MADATTAFIVLASVQGAATLVLVIVTAFYALRTRDIADAARQEAVASSEIAQEMRAQRFEGFRPVIKASYFVHNGKVGETPSIEITPINIGLGPALRVRCAFEHPRFAYHDHWWLYLGPQDKEQSQRIQRHASEDKSNIQASVGTQASIVLQYEDIFGRYFETRMVLEQNYLGWTERGTTYEKVAEKAPQERGPSSPKVWHDIKITAPTSASEIKP